MGVFLLDRKYVAVIFNNARDFRFHYLAVDSELKWQRWESFPIIDSALWECFVGRVAYPNWPFRRVHQEADERDWLGCAIDSCAGSRHYIRTNLCSGPKASAPGAVIG